MIPNRNLLMVFILTSFTPACLMPAAKQNGIVAFRPSPDLSRPVKIHVNQVGYQSEAPKQIVVESVDEQNRFRLIATDGASIVLEADLQPVPGFKEWGGGPFFAIADISEISDPGQYQMVVDDVHSMPFRIGDREILNATFNSLLRYFNESRASDGDVWRTDRAVPVIGTPVTVDARGGWYDASGDISKYLSHLSYANYFNPQQIPLVAWGLAWVSGVGTSKGLDEQTLGRAASEATWGGDYLVRVLSGEGYFYSTVFDRWTGEMADRTICSFRYQSGAMSSAFQAAFREGGGMAVAALARISLLKRRGMYTSEQYLDAARRGFAHLQQYNLRYVDNARENIIDDYTALMAAQELFRATAEPIYLDNARTRARSIASRLHAEGYFIADGRARPFWHASDAGLPIVAMVLYAEQEPDIVHRKAAVEVIRSHLEYLLKVTRGAPNPYGYARQHVSVGGDVFDGFFIPHENETEYWWQGENARIASVAAAAFIAEHFLKAEGVAVSACESFAWAQMNWILGMNPLDLCFLKGAGTANPPDFSHSKPQHGDLVGGIANGITGADRSGRGIDWYDLPGRKHDASDKWRWLEQWLPHSAWFMVALLAGQAEAESALVPEKFGQ